MCLLQSLPLLGLLYAFLLPNSSSPVLSLSLYSCYFGLPWPISSLLGSFVPILFFWASLAYFIAFGLLRPIRAPSSYLFSFGRLGPICFPWASLALFITSHYHGLLLTSLGFPGPITLFSSLRLMGLPSTPYFLCFHYFGPAAAHSHFFTSYTAHGLLFLSFRAPLGPFTSLRPICLSHGPVIHYSCHSGLMVFFSIY